MKLLKSVRNNFLKYEEGKPKKIWNKIEKLEKDLRLKMIKTEINGEIAAKWSTWFNWEDHVLCRMEKIFFLFPSH